MTKFYFNYINIKDLYFLFLYNVDRNLYKVDPSFYEEDKKIEDIFVSTSYKLRSISYKLQSTSYKLHKKKCEEKKFHLTLPIIKNMKKNLVNIR